MCLALSQDVETLSSTAHCQGKVLDATQESHFVAVWT